LYYILAILFYFYSFGADYSFYGAE